jgi:hypothetical protein
MPATKLYGSNSESLRDRFVAQYGETTVHKAEHQVLLDLMLLLGVIKPSEFVDVLTKKLQRVDDLRRHAAGVPE